MSSAIVAAPAAHLVEVDADWTLWRTVGVRGAGFPAAGVLELADEASAAAADRWAPDPLRPYEVPPELRSTIEAAFARGATALRRILRSPRFREAVTWQNRELVERFDRVLLAEPARRASAERLAELTVSSYWQRYSVKNDAIGYFGPFGWGVFTDAGEAVTARPGSGLLRNREVFFEEWAIAALAEVMVADSRLRPWLAPRRLPFLHLDGTTVHRPYSPPLSLTPAEGEVLASCDGELTAREIAAQARRNAGSGLMTDAEVYRLLERLQTRGLLAWALDLRPRLRPEEELARALRRIGDPELRSWAIGRLDEMAEARSAVAAAAGDSEALGHALARLDQTFERVTGKEASRAHGETYGARRVVYEDCCRDLELELGPAVLDALRAPLSLVLASARWMTHRLADDYREAFWGAYREQSARAGAATVDLATFPFMSLLDMAGTRADPIALEAAERWAAILAVPYGERRVGRSSAELATAVGEAFAAPGPGWPLARYQSPDIMIDAPSLEAIRAGDFQVVLGELHLAFNTLQIACQVAQHSEPHLLQQWFEADVPEPTVVPIIPPGWNQISCRLYVCMESPKDLYLALGPDPGAHPPGRGLPLAALVVEERRGRLWARTRDGSAGFDLVEVFGMLLGHMLVRRFQIHRSRPHLPRVTIDRVVICRESWMLPAAELSFARVTDEVTRFLLARAWARGLGLPRFTFLRTPVEVKPVFVDFASPTYVSLFCKLVRAVQEADPEGSMTLTEMLPDPLHAWLPDADGNRYTCELRLVAVDRRPPR